MLFEVCDCGWEEKRKRKRFMCNSDEEF